MTEPFKVVCADPPWPFNDKLPGETRGAIKNYKTMRVQDIMDFPLPAIADDAVLFMWKVASMPQEALYVISAWGFTPKTEVVWLKKTVHGKRWFGMGHTLRAEHETAIVATKGRPHVKNHSTRSTFMTEVDFAGLSDTVQRHSQKPDKFYEIVESLFDGPYLELFARQTREGWTSIGDELEAVNHKMGEVAEQYAANEEDKADANNS